MSQCVPSWDIDDHLHRHGDDQRAALPTSTATATAMSVVNYDVIELMWNDVGLGKPILRNLSSIAAVSTSDGGGGTLECIVDQARSGAHQPSSDAMVPSSNAGERIPATVSGTSCTSQGSATPAAAVRKRKIMTLRSSLPLAGDMEVEGCDGGGSSPETENRSFAAGRPLDSVRDNMRCRKDGLGESRITPISAKRGREAAVHSQSERKRRDRINQKMKTLQKLLPNSSKTNKASMLDEVIEYLKLLQAQVQMMSRMSSFPAMMLPIAMHHQQLQLSMIAQMTQISRMGMSLGMIDPSLLNPPAPPPIFHPSAFLPIPSPTAGAWDARTAEWMQQAFMAGQAQHQPMSSEAYSRLATLYQQLYQQPLGSNQKT